MLLFLKPFYILLNDPLFFAYSFESKPKRSLLNYFQAEAHKLTISAFGNWEGVNCFNDESAQCSHVPTIQCSTNLSTMVTRFDDQHFSAAMPDAMSSIYSPSGLSGLDDYGLQCLENVGVGFDLPLSSPVQDINSFIHDADSSSATQPFSGDRSLPYFDHNYYIQTPIHSPGNNFPAQRRWKMLFSVFRWFSVRRIVAKKGKEIC